jgi:hypothetical protein
LSGNALDITQAFNGGILVADTSDATGGSVVPAPGTTAGGGSNLSGGDAYIQDGVDQILWTGAGNRTSSSSGGTLGTIIVPPGKTLFIGGDLVINGDGATSSTVFSGVRVLDKGGYAPAAGGEEPSLSILAATGANVGSGDSAGKIVFLAGSTVRVEEDSTTPAAAGTFAIGGDLEIHRGATVNLTPKGTTSITTLFVATEGSKIDVYGSLILGVEDPSGSLTTDIPANVINGELIIREGAKVDADKDIDGLAFGGDVTLDGALTLPAAGDVDFNGNLTVGKKTGLILGGTTSFNKKAAIKGYLDLNSQTYAVGTSGHLAIEAGGIIGNGAWAGTPDQLAKAFAADDPKDENGRVTIADGEYNLNLSLAVAAYADLVKLAALEKLHVQALTFSGAAPAGADKLVVAKGNHVSWGGAALPDVEVQDGGALTLTGTSSGTGVVTNAGNITLIGKGRAAASTGSFALTGVASPLIAGEATFAASLGSLTVGDGNTQTSVTIGGTATTFASAKTTITVKKGAVLTVGNAATTAIDIPGTIILEDGDAAEGGYAGGQFIVGDIGTGVTTTASFGSTEIIKVGKRASFNADKLGDAVTFAKLTTLTVDAGGSLSIASTGSTTTADLFKDLQEKIAKSGEVVSGDGSFISKWAVTAAKDHAFDQILGIKNVTVASVAGIPSTSGFPDKYTEDRGTTSGTGYTLTVDSITALAGGLTVNRDLVVTTGTGHAITLTGSAPLIITGGKTISAGKTIVLTSSGGAELTSGGGTTLTATTAGVFTGGAAGLTLKAGNTLNVPGKLVIGAGNFIAGGADAAKGQLLLTGNAATYVAKVDIASTPPASTTGVSTVTLTIHEEGELSNGGGASVVGLNSSIVAGKNSQIIGASSSKLNFYGASIGEGTLKTVDGGTFKTASVATDAGTATLSGDWKASGGAAVLTGGVSGGKTEILTLSGSVAVSVGENEYNTAELGSSTLVKGVVFNAVDGKIELKDGTLTGGSLTTKGNGFLEFVTDNTLQTGGEALTIGSTVILSKAGIETGSLALNKGTLTIGDGFSIGTVGTGGETSPSTVDLTVSGTGKILNSDTITLLGLNGTSGSSDWGKGQLSFGDFKLAGVAKTGGVLTGSFTVSGSGTITKGSETGFTAQASDLYGEFSGSQTAITAVLGSEVELGSDGKITITGGTNATINAGSRLVSTTE